MVLVDSKTLNVSKQPRTTVACKHALIGLAFLYFGQKLHVRLYDVRLTFSWVIIAIFFQNILPLQEPGTWLFSSDNKLESGNSLQNIHISSQMSSSPTYSDITVCCTTPMLLNYQMNYRTYLRFSERCGML